MPTLPQSTKDIKDLKSVDVLNSIRGEMDSEYQELVPKALKIGETYNGKSVTRADGTARLREIGDVLTVYPNLMNSFVSALVNRIAKVIITSKLYKNPWASFKKGMIEYGETIEEIFVGIATPYQFDPQKAEQEVFKRRNPDIKSAFHAMNYQKFYPTTVTNAELRQAFLSYEGVTDLINRIIEQVYTGANYDEFLVMKYLIAKVALNGGIYPVHIDTVTAENARTVTSQMVAQAKKLEFMTKEYNEAGVPTYTDRSKLYMILTTDIQSIFDVEVLALSFNMSKAELLGRQVSIDGFGVFDDDRLKALFSDDPNFIYVPFTSQEKQSLSKIAGLMVDEDWFMIFDNLTEMSEIYNPQGLYWNYFYHVWKTLSVSPFSNAVLFTEEIPTVSSVTISPKPVTVKKGQQVKFTATVKTVGMARKTVHWEVSGGGQSTISEEGVLTVGGNESLSTLTVTATSIFTPSAKDTCTVTVQA